VSFDADLISNFERVEFPSELAQKNGTAKLKIPGGNNSSIVLDVQIETRMRIHPFDLGDRAGELRDFRRIVFSGEGMMRGDDFRGQKQSQSCSQKAGLYSH